MDIAEYISSSVDCKTCGAPLEESEQDTCIDCLASKLGIDLDGVPNTRAMFIENESMF